MVVREQLRMLVRLQRIDLEREHALEERDENPRRAARLEEELAGAAAKVEETKARVEELRKERRDLEREIDEGDGKLKKSQGRLLEVKTNQEYKAMLKEIEHQGQANRKHEDRVLELMEEVSTTEKELASLRAAYKEQEADIKARMAELEVASARFEEEAKQLEERRRELVGGLAAELISKYDFIRSRRNGTAVVAVRDSVCQACYMDIPPQSFNELQRSEQLMTCPSCSRIIYWADAEDLREAV